MENESHKICRVCGFTSTNCVGHSGLLPTTRDTLLAPVSPERQREAAKTYSDNQAWWENQIKGKPNRFGRPSLPGSWA